MDPKAFESVMQNGTNYKRHPMFFNIPFDKSNPKLCFSYAMECNKYISLHSHTKLIKVISVVPKLWCIDDLKMYPLVKGVTNIKTHEGNPLCIFLNRMTDQQGIPARSFDSEGIHYKPMLFDSL